MSSTNPLTATVVAEYLDALPPEFTQSIVAAAEKWHAARESRRALALLVKSLRDLTLPRLPGLIEPHDSPWTLAEADALHSGEDQRVTKEVRLVHHAIRQLLASTPDSEARVDAAVAYFDALDAKYADPALTFLRATRAA